MSETPPRTEDRMRKRVHRDSPRVRHTYPGWAAALGAAVAAAGGAMIWYYTAGGGGRHAVVLLKFGESRVVYGTVPLYAGERLRLHFEGGRLLENCPSLEAQLLCVEEFYERAGENSRAVYEQLYRDAVTFATGAAGTAQLGFDLPRDAPGTRLAVQAGEYPRYWELVVSANLPGIDYEGVFLLPIYAQA
jgi:hypothetical protein